MSLGLAILWICGGTAGRRRFHLFRSRRRTRLDYREPERLMNPSEDLTVKIFADGADIADITAAAKNPLIKGFTTNPTLMRKAGVADYKAFAKDVVAAVPDYPVSVEVFADEFDEMERQALEISGWGDNLNVKIPITNTKGESSCPLIERLAGQGVRLNITALMTAPQVRDVVAVMGQAPGGYVSVFAGRIADTGRDPVPVMTEALETMSQAPNLELIWASPREVFDIVRANDIGCDVITVTYDLLRKTALFGKDLDAFSLETVKMFFDDARQAGYDV